MPPEYLAMMQQALMSGAQAPGPGPGGLYAPTPLGAAAPVDLAYGVNPFPWMVEGGPEQMNLWEHGTAKQGIAETSGANFDQQMLEMIMGQLMGHAPASGRGGERVGADASGAAVPADMIAKALMMTGATPGRRTAPATAPDAPEPPDRDMR